MSEEKKSQFINNLLDPVDVGNYRNSYYNSPELENSIKMIETNQEQSKLHSQLDNKKKWYSILATQAILSIIPVIFSIFFILLFNPPITQKKRKDELSVEKQDWIKVLIFISLAFLLALITPEVIRILILKTSKR